MPTTVQPRQQLAEIRAEFDHRIRRDPAEVFESWARREPVLQAAESIDDVLELTSTRSPKQTRDATILALVRLAQGQWSQEATLVIVAAMQPKLWAMSRRRRRRDLSMRRTEEKYVALQSALVEEIQALRTTRQAAGTVACLALNALHRTSTVRDADRNMEWWSMDAYLDGHGGGEVHRVTDHVCKELGTFPARPSVARSPHRDLTAESPETLVTESARWAGHDAPCREDDIVTTLAWAVRTGLLSDDDARLLYEVNVEPRCSSDATTARRSAATRRGVSPAAIRQRCARATRTLAAGLRNAHGQQVSTLRAA